MKVFIFFIALFLEVQAVADFSSETKEAYEKALESNTTFKLLHEQGKIPLLILAVWQQEHELIGHLLKETDLDMNIRESETDSTALHYAAFNGDEKTVILLLKNPKIELYPKNKRGFTPSQLASGRNRLLWKVRQAPVEIRRPYMSIPDLIKGEERRRRIEKTQCSRL